MYKEQYLIQDILEIDLNAEDVSRPGLQNYIKSYTIGATNIDTGYSFNELVEFLKSLPYIIVYGNECIDRVYIEIDINMIPKNLTN